MSAQGRLAIYGATGHGRDLLAMLGRPLDTLIYVDDHASEAESCGIPVVSFDRFCEMSGGTEDIVVAVSDGRIRAQLVARCEQAGLCVTGVVANSALVSPHATVGKAAVVGPQSVISSAVEIGDHVQINTLCNIAHDCRIGDYVSLAPGAMLNGCVVVEDYAYIGARAVIRQGTLHCPRRIGKGAVIGMGAVVLEDVADGETVVGNPARPIRKVKDNS